MTSHSSGARWRGWFKVALAAGALVAVAGCGDDTLPAGVDGGQPDVAGVDLRI